jgi:hypothetical protein
MGVAWSVALGFLAAWLAAGSMGVLTSSLQNLLAGLALVTSLLSARPQFTRRMWLALLASAATLLVLGRWVHAPGDSLVLVIALVLSWSSTGLQGRERHVLALASLSVLALALFRFAQQSLPAVWMLSDQIGAVLGLAAGALTGRPLTISASFGGLDFLLVVGVFLVGWSALLRQNRGASLTMALVAMLIVHLAYLVLLSLLNELTRLVPPVPPPGPDNPYVPPPFSWSVILRQCLPWNMPALAAGLQVAIVLVLLRNGTYAVPSAIADAAHGRPASSRNRVVVAIAGLAVLIPLWGALCRLDGLEGKRILANAQGQLDWNRPQHDQYGQDSAGTLGMLSALVESLGAKLHTSKEFSQAELDSADLLLVVEPDASLTGDQQNRIWDYVREGGSLLVVSEGFSAENGLQRVVNELLRDTSIAVRSDAAVSETRDWWGSLRALHHPAMQAASPHVARIVSDQGASLRVSWPARPLLSGLWGWSTAEPMSRDENTWGYQEGQRLGDLTLAAEQRVGAGRVVVVGDVTCLSNEGLADGYPWVSQLLSYLASSASGPQVLWRQAGLLLTLLALMVVLTRNLAVVPVAVSSVCLALSLLCCHGLSNASSLLIPDGTRIATPAGSSAGNRLAYIDASHLAPFSRQSWGYDALNGLVLNLERNGYLPLMLHDHLEQRLPGAGVLISIAPAQALSPAECRRVRRFVEEGGSLVCMVGAEEANASDRLLSSLGLSVPVSPVPTAGGQYEPEPFGRTTAEYLQVEQEDGTSYTVSLRLYAAWPVEALKMNSDNTEVIAYARNTLPYVESDTELPVVLLHSIKEGLIVLIGDTRFAMNRNLEYVGGEPFAGRHDNALFWRWLLTQLKGEPQWVPPRPPEPPSGGAKTDSEEVSSSEEES